MIVRFTILTLILSGISTIDSYRILAIFPFPGRSHFHVLEPIAKTLARKGHQVDVLSHFKLKEPFQNYKELEFPTAESHARIDFNSTLSSEAQREWVIKYQTPICNLLGHQTISNLLKNPPTNPPYDAMIVHMIFGIECLSAIGYIWNIPVIGVVTTMAYAPFQQLVGNPLSLAIAPGHTDYYKQNLTFWERVENVLKTHNRIRDFHGNAHMQEYFLKKYLGPDIPHYSELQKSFALVFTNSHYSFYGIKPKTPAIVEIGGINIKNDTSKLSPDLQKLLDESINGFIYFSFGTLTALETLPIGVLEKLFVAFSKISPITVIMRVPNPDIVPQNVSDNMHMLDWVPQQKILEHPNIKAFVTHGGGLSSQETIHYSVPVICIPLFAEQKLNCDIFALKNMGIKIDIHTALQRDYDDAFDKILSDTTYKKSMKTFSRLYWDRPQSPQEAVNYWVEYVIRHGKTVLRSPAVDLKWWQFELVDVYCFLFSCFLFLTLLTIVTVRYIFKLFIRFSIQFKVVQFSKKFN